MRYKDYEARRGRVLSSKINYTYDYYLNRDYDILRNVLTRRRNGSKAKTTYSEAWIMLDTETSRSEPLKKGFLGRYQPSENYIVAFTCSIRIFEKNVCTLRGSKPSELCHMLKLIREHIPGDRVYIFVHNLAYDWQFIRRFLYQITIFNCCFNTGCRTICEIIFSIKCTFCVPFFLPFFRILRFFYTFFKFTLDFFTFYCAIKRYGNPISFVHMVCRINAVLLRLLLPKRTEL